MAPQQRHHTIRPFARLAVIITLILVGLSMVPRAAQAQTIIRGDRVFSGQVIDNDVIMYGTDVRLSGTVIGNAFVIGRDVTIDGNVQGSLFVIARRVIINGTVEGSAYVIAVTAQLGSNAVIGQNLYFVGVSLTTDRTSRIGRDLNGIALGAIIQGSVGRNTRLVAGLVQLLSIFMDTALGPAPELLRAARLSQRAPGLGQFLLPGDIVIDLFGQRIGPAQTSADAQSRSTLIVEWLRFRLRDFLPLLTVGLVSYWFFRRRLEESALVMRTRPLRALAVGLVGLVLSAAVIGAFILVFILVLMIGIWLGTVNLWNMSWLFWSVAFPLTALAMALFLIFLNYGTKAIIAFAGVNFLAGRFRPQGSRYQWLLFILGLLVFVFLRAIPILGWVIGVVVTAWGIGAAWLAWRAGNVPEPPASHAEDSENKSPAQPSDETAGIA